MNPDELNRQRLRENHQVRPLTPDEEGTSVAKLPGGVFGFTYAPATETPLFGKHSWHSFEVHKLRGGTELVLGYVRPGDGPELRLYPGPFGEATELVALDAANLQRSNAKAGREEGNPIRVRVLSGAAAQAG